VRTLALVVTMVIMSTMANAAEIDAFVSTAIKAATDEIFPAFERDSGYTIRASFAPSGALIPRFERGEPVDLFLSDSTAIDKLIAEGKIAGGRIDLLRIGIGLCVRKGAPKPDVSTPDALGRTLLAVSTVAYPSPASGSITQAHIREVFAKLGIADQMAPKARLSAGGPNGRVSVLVSSGEAELGIQQVSELKSNPGVDVIGMFPDALQQVTVYSAGVTANAREPAGARALIGALTAPAAMAIFKANGLDPPSGC
jgi:molybdate transport system substrate-binding protein